MKTHVYKAKFWLAHESLENNKLIFNFMPFKNDHIEKMLFAERFKIQKSVRCTHCDQKHNIVEYQQSSNYSTKYKHLPYNWFYDNLFDIQFALYEMYGFWALHYNIIGNAFDRLNFKQEFVSNNGWFKTTVDLDIK